MTTISFQKKGIMIKVALAAILAAMPVSESCYGEQQTVTIPVEDYQAILNRLDALQQRVEFLEARPPAPAAAQVQATPDEEGDRYNKLAGDINDIYNTIDDLETKKLQNKLNFGAELRTRVDSFKGENYDYLNLTKFLEAYNGGASYLEAGLLAHEHQDSYNDYNNWFSRFRITMDAQVTDTIDFHGRLVAEGYWGDSDSGDSFVDKSRILMGSQENQLVFDRFYINWIPANLPFPFALTVGRQPSSEPPPFELRENTVRQSTYPALLFNGIHDGVVATLGLDRYTGLNNSGLRFAYGKAYHSDSDSYLTPFPFFDDGETADSDIYAGFLESEIPGLDDSLMVFSYARILGLPTVFFGPTGASYQLSNENLGDMDLWGIHLQAKNIFDSGLDLFFSYAGNHSKPDQPTTIGLLSWGNTEEQSGHAFYSGLRYTIPFEPLNNPKFGFEYNYGSRYWYSMTVGYSSPFNKLATRGSVFDFYYIQPVNKHLFFRVGYVRADYDYASGLYLGEPEPSDAVLEDLYLLMDIRF